MTEGVTKNPAKPGRRGFGVPALAGGAVARSSALKFFDVMLVPSAPPPEGGTPNLSYFGRSAAALCFLVLWPAVAFAQTNTVKLGPVELEPNKVREFYVAPDARAQWESNQRGQKIQNVKVALAVPDGFDPRKTWPLLIVSAPSGGSSVRSVSAYTGVALSAGWIVLGADGPPTKAEHDTFTWGWAMLSSGLEFVHKFWPDSKKWPVACAGFSGGAKRSGMIGAIMMKENYSVIGMFMGGCNEDNASLGLRVSQPGEQFKQVPIFLSSGMTDPIATPEQHAVVKQSMYRTGFERIRLENYEGGHRLDNETLGRALDWFLKQSTNKVSAKDLSTNPGSAK